ncbi:MAG: hypothetical protein Q9206_007379, partial [Seirophora lacunosa]
TGDRLPLPAIIDCLHLIRSDIAWYIINHPQSPATGNYVQQNNVRVTFAPQRMTWTTAEKSGGGSQFSPPSGNSTFLANRPQNTPLTDRPEIPHPFLIPGSHISLVCTRYGQALDPETVFALLIAAQKSVSRRLKQIGPLATVDKLTPWKLNNVMFEIRLEPDGKLRWSDLVVASEGVVDFLIKFQTFEFTFEIRWEGSRSLGFGQLRGKG